MPAEAEPGRWSPYAFTLDSGNPADLIASGQAAVQDEASQLAVIALTRAPLTPAADTVHRADTGGERWLDLCAGPGGKARLLAGLGAGRSARLVAADIRPHRAGRVLDTLRRARLTPAAAVIAADGLRVPWRPGTFDRVLADVPCSGTGTLARNPEIKWRLTPADLAELRDRQLSILRAALAHVALNGRIIYSTCSLEKEENEDVVELALAENKSFRRVDCNRVLEKLRTAGQLTWPDLSSLTRGPYLRTIPGIHPCDGFFAAILERS
jgi:16S rRNA (cytosine967-C5)-methyltransferase